MARKRYKPGFDPLEFEKGEGAPAACSCSGGFVAALLEAEPGWEAQGWLNSTRCHPGPPRRCAPAAGWEGAAAGGVHHAPRQEGVQGRPLELVPHLHTFSLLTPSSAAPVCERRVAAPANMTAPG